MTSKGGSILGGSLFRICNINSTNNKSPRFMTEIDLGKYRLYSLLANTPEITFGNGAQAIKAYIDVPVLPLPEHCRR